MPAPEDPVEDADDTCRLIVSGHLGDARYIDLAEGEARQRLIPWIGREVMNTQRTVGTQPISLRSMQYQGGRIIIHPCNREAGERLANTIRSQMTSENHPSGFSAKFNESLRKG